MAHSKKKEQEPHIYKYNNYREFLKDIYDHRKKNRTTYSYRQYSRALGFGGSNFIHLIIQGKRNLSESSLLKIQKYFNWNATEKKFFEYLVGMNQAKTEEEKEDFFDKLKTLIKNKKILINPDQYVYFKNWNLPLLRELISLKDFKMNIAWINKKLKVQLNKDQIQEAFEVLQRLGFISKENDHWIQTQEHLTTGEEITSEMIYNYHKEMLKLSQEALDFDVDDRDISAITMSLTSSQFKKLKQKIIAFREEIQQDLQETTHKEDQIAQLNIQLFKMTND